MNIHETEKASFIIHSHEVMHLIIQIVRLCLSICHRRCHVSLGRLSYCQLVDVKLAQSGIVAHNGHHLERVVAEPHALLGQQLTSGRKRRLQRRQWRPTSW